MMNFMLAETQRALYAISMVATVTAVDTINARCRVSLGGMESAWLPWLAAAGSLRCWHSPVVGEQVLLLSPGGDLAQAVVVGSLFSNNHPAPDNNPDVHTLVCDDGAVIRYDQAAHALTCVLPAGGTAQLTADGGVTINGNVTINGSLTTSGDTVAAGVSVQHHRHGGVQAGGSSTGAPQ